ncbi:AraC family transcriptional regulator [Caulobacter radicis]|uniref:helix-turn-helix domain-containing protein n=1 Tax=Caulobacter radicis TaxID=2172650 RepID=UPI000D578B56|nr:AraC family transcriptional regulator [Caulobacter radicis]PVM88425.1 AraC family transcriptional regulator [Caulobacter radicis]
MEPAINLTTSSGSYRLVAGLLVAALDELAPDQSEIRAKLARAIQLVGGAPTPLVHSGGFAPWQSKRIETHISQNLETQLRLDDLAAMVRVSRSHFSRAFKKSFKQCFSRYVMSLRLERARMLLVNTEAPISQVALACGLTDQPHLTRLFHREYGAPPNAWRRAHSQLRQVTEKTA